MRRSRSGAGVARRDPGHAADVPLRSDATREPPGAPRRRRRAAAARRAGGPLAGGTTKSVGDARIALHRLAHARACSGMNIMGTGLWSIGFSVVQARTRKLLKRLMATPMPQEPTTCVPPARAAGVPRARGRRAPGLRLPGLRRPHRRIGVRSWRGCALLGALSFSRARLCWWRSRAKTIEAVSGLMNLAMLPMWLLSGVFFAAANFPDVAAAVHPAAAAHGAERRAAGRDAGGAGPHRDRARGDDAGGLGRRHVRAGGEAVPLAVTEMGSGGVCRFCDGAEPTSQNLQTPPDPIPARLTGPRCAASAGTPAGPSCGPPRGSCRRASLRRAPGPRASRFPRPSRPT